MFTKTAALSASLLALGASAKPVASRRQITPIFQADGSRFDLGSSTVTGFNTGLPSFDNFGGLSSLNGFDGFFGQGNFCGAQNVQVLNVQQPVVQCAATQINVVQQQLAIVAEYAKRVILTQSCETEAQVLLFSQWLGGLVQFGQDLRRTDGRFVTFDGVVANQINQVVDVSGQIVTQDFGFSGTNIGAHGVTVLGGNWNDIFSPATVGLSWEHAVLAAGPSIPLGVSCSSSVCTSPVILQHAQPVILPAIHQNLPSIHHNGGVIVSSHTVTAPPVIITAGVSHGAPVHIPSHNGGGVIFGGEGSVGVEGFPIEGNVGVEGSVGIEGFPSGGGEGVEGFPVEEQRTGDVDVEEVGVEPVDVNETDVAATETSVDAAAETDDAIVPILPTEETPVSDGAADAGGDGGEVNVSVQPQAAEVLATPAALSPRRTFRSRVRRV